MNVNVTDCGLENSDLRAVVTCLDHNSFFLDTDDLTDNSANGGDLVADLDYSAEALWLVYASLQYVTVIKPDVNDEKVYACCKGAVGTR